MAPIPKQSCRILVLSPTQGDFRRLVDALNRLGDDHECHHASSRTLFEQMVRHGPWDLIICSCQIPDYSIEEALTVRRNEANLAPLLIVSDCPSVEEIDRAFALGAWDYMGPEGFPRLPWAARTLFDESRLIRLAARHARLFKESPYGMIFIDRSATVIQANEEATRQFRYPLEELLGKSATLLLPPEYREAYQARFEESFRTGKPRDFHLRAATSCLRKDGSIFPADVFIRSMPEPEDDVSVIRIHDLSERRALELQVSRSDRLDAIGRFAGGIAHDLNNALAPVLMSLELLRIHHPESKEILDTAESAGGRCKELLSELLAYSRGAVLEPLRIETQSFLCRFIHLVTPRIPKSIQLRLDIGGTVGDIWGDPAQLMQVLTNITHNAADAMPGGGTITVLVEDVTLDRSDSGKFQNLVFGHYVKIAIADTGEGISSENLVRIFEPFYTTKKHGKGTGLGLSIVSGIIKGHGGHLEVSSTVGEGSVFTIYVPALSA